MTSNATTVPHPLPVRLNGVPLRVDAADSHRTLLEALRDAGLTGTKEGCNEGDCGACTVLVAQPGADGKPGWRATNSCILPLWTVAGRDIRTVEGLDAADSTGTPCRPRRHESPRSLHPVQAALVRHHGSQCGYCTPGIVMSLVEACHRRDLSTLEDLDGQLAGNLCRCTGYRALRDAALEALESARQGAGLIPMPALPHGPAGPTESSLPDDCHRPTDLVSLLGILGRFPSARCIAGATDLGPEITRRFRRFETLVSLEHVRELLELRRTPDAWHIGAAVTLTVLGEVLGGEFPEIDAMLRGFGSRQIRNRATLGGNLATASPVACAATLLLAMDASLVLASAAGERTVPLDGFFPGYRTTILRPGEVLKTIVLARDAGFRRAFRKVSKRPDVDIATVSMGFAVKLDAGGRVIAARIACGGVAPFPARAHRTEAALLGQPLDAARIARATRVLGEEFTPISDVRGGADYRRRALAGLLEGFLADDAMEPSRTPLPPAGPAPDAPPHESARLHVTGRALFVDDAARGMLETCLVLSPHAHARILRRDATAASRIDGVVAVLFASDVPGINDVGAVRNDEPLLAGDEVLHHGQPVALVVARTAALAREAADAVVVDYLPLPAQTDTRSAIAAGSLHGPPNHIRRGDAAAELARAPHRITGELAIGGQDHFYLETQSCWAEPGEDGSVSVHSSTQHPSGVQAIVSRVLGLPMNRVTVECPRLGGGFGGKETQASAPAALAALAAAATGRSVRVRHSRERDMIVTGKRHPFLARFEAGFDDDGRIRAARVELFADGGCSLDLSRSIADRALLHLDNAYYIPAVDFQGTVVKTHVVSHTAFRGFGGPQGMVVIEEIMDRVARHRGLPPETVRERNLYHGDGGTDTTHYGQRVPVGRIGRVWSGVKAGSEFAERRRALGEWNRAHPRRKRGIAITPVKFGISFTLSFLNQAGALVLVHRDGTVEVNHGGTEMGQGLHTNLAHVAATTLDVPPDRVRMMPTRTDKVPNAPATAASCGTDLNGMAVRQACTVLAERLAPFRTAGKTFADAVEDAYRARVSLSSMGHYHTPGLSMDWNTGRGHPFHYFAVGAAVSEVEVDGRTGMARVLRVDVLHDVGNAINPAVCRGQIEGGFVQGMGWLTTEELAWDGAGRLLTHSPETYKIPTFADVPRDFRVAFLEDAAQPGTIHGSKAVGEPPFMLAISVREAIRDAIAAFGVRGEIALASPATAEAILRLIPPTPEEMSHD